MKFGFKICVCCDNFLDAHIVNLSALYQLEIFRKVAHDRSITSRVSQGYRILVRMQENAIGTVQQCFVSCQMYTQVTASEAAVQEDAQPDTML